MKSQMPPKAILPLSVAGTLVVLALVLGCLSYAGRPSRSLSQPRVFPGPAARRAPIFPPPALPRAATLPRQAILPRPATLPRPGVPGPFPAPGAMRPPSAPDAPTGPGMAQFPGVPHGPGMAAQQPPVRPGLPLPSMSPATNPPGKPSAATASTGAGTPGASTEDAIVGTSPHGRGDPFSPLVVPESGRPIPSTPSPSLPPPPGVGLPVPPGLGTPGGGTTPPPAPGAGMRVAGIMGSRSKVAIIESEGKTYIVGVGERVGDTVVVSIQTDKVVMRQKGVTFELGFGGERSS